MTWEVFAFDEMDAHALHDVLRLRVDVFVVEQRCIYPEVDGLDPVARHLLVRNAEGELVAYARILPPQADGMPHLGRFVIHPDHRGKGLAHTLIRRTMAEAQAWTGCERLALAAQTHLEALYAAHGFRRVGPDYDWDGIPHVDMVYEGAALSG